MACIQEKGRLLEGIPVLVRFGTIRSNRHDLSMRSSESYGIANVLMFLDGVLKRRSL